RESNEKGSEVPSDRFMAGHSRVADFKICRRDSLAARIVHVQIACLISVACFGIATNLKTIITIAILISLLMLPHRDAFPWNIPSHMVNGAITYQILQRESSAAIPTTRTILEKHPWYADRWRDDLAKLPDSHRDEMLFMLAARWADDIRNRDRAESHPAW